MEQLLGQLWFQTIIDSPLFTLGVVGASLACLWRIGTLESRADVHAKRIHSEALMPLAIAITETLSKMQMSQAQSHLMQVDYFIAEYARAISEFESGGSLIVGNYSAKNPLASKLAAASGPIEFAENLAFGSVEVWPLTPRDSFTTQDVAASGMMSSGYRFYLDPGQNADYIKDHKQMLELIKARTQKLQSRLSNQINFGSNVADAAEGLRQWSKDLIASTRS